MKKLQVTSYRLKVLTALIFSLLFNKNFAQTSSATGKKPFSLKQCIDYALQNQYSMKNATLGEALAKAKVGEVVAAGLPQINGNVQLSTNDPLRRMFFDPTNPSIALFFPPGYKLPDEKVIAMQNFFQLGNTGDAGLSISQLIFSSSYFIGLQAAKTYQDLASKQTEQTKIQVIEAVTKAYYSVLINEERIILFKKNIAQIDSLLKQTKVMFENGMVENIDVKRIEVSYNNVVTETEKFSNILLLSRALLNYQMSMPLDSEMTLTEKISNLSIETKNISSAQKPNYSNRIEVSLLETQKKLQLLDLKNNRFTYLPTLAAFGNVGEFSQSTKFDYLTSNNLWYGYAMFGLTLNVPIFDGLKQQHKIQESKLNLKVTENNLSNMQLTVDLQIKTAELNLKNSLSALELQKKNIDLAGEVTRVTKAKFQQGVGSSLDVTTSETSLLEAQTNYYNALYDALISKVDYDVANGNIK